MAKAKEVLEKIFCGIIGATAWQMVENTEWVIRVKNNLIQLQTTNPERPARLMWQVVATIIIAGIVYMAVGKLKKKFTLSAFIIAGAAFLWLLYIFIVVYVSIDMALGGDPEGLKRIIGALWGTH